MHPPPGHVFGNTWFKGLWCLDRAMHMPAFPGAICIASEKSCRHAFHVHFFYNLQGSAALHCHHMPSSSLVTARDMPLVSLRPRILWNVPSFQERATGALSEGLNKPLTLLYKSFFHYPMDSMDQWMVHQRALFLGLGRISCKARIHFDTPRYTKIHSDTQT